MKLSYIYIFLAIVLFSPLSIVYAQSDLLTNEENIWLSSRNNTISIIPERNNPPFSFNDSSYISQGIFVDYIKLVAEKLDIKADFLTSRTRTDIIIGMSENKAEYVSTLEVDKTQDLPVLFNEPYSTFPIVIAVRKDYDSREGMTLDDFNNRSVAVIQGTPASLYIKKNYPRVISVEVVDNELALQKVALNEVDATVINSASLTYLLSKQSMRSIKVVGSLTLDSKMAFTVPKDKTILNSILSKGMQKVSAKEHQQIIDKWISLPNDKNTRNPFYIYLDNNLTVISIISFFCIIIITMLIFFRSKKYNFSHIDIKKSNKMNELEQEIAELESASKTLIGELKEVKNLEEDIKDKMQNIEK